MRAVVRKKHIPTQAKVECTITNTSKNVPGLPSEIWDKIAFFACTDREKTAAVLLRVSRTVSQGAELHAYTIVTLIGPRSVASFRHDMIRHHDRRARVRALFIAEKDDSGRDVVALSRERRDMAQHLRPLLLLVSSSIQSLALINFIPRTLSSVPLPALRYLIIRGPGYHAVEDIRTLHALTHLHVSMHYRYGFKLDGANPLKLVPIAATRMPSIESVTLSMTSRARQPSWMLTRELQKERVDCLKDRACNARLDRPIRFIMLDNQESKRSHSGLWLDAQSKELEREAGKGWDFQINEMPENLEKDTSEAWLAFWLDHVLHDLYSA